MDNPYAPPRPSRRSAAFADSNHVGDRTRAPSGANSRRALSFNTVRITARVYAVYCVTLVPLRVFTQVPHLSLWATSVQLLLFALLALALLSASRRSRVGYYACWLFSVLILPAPWLGTVIGWNMIRALRQNRDHFI